MSDILQRIRDLQFTQKEEAERLLLLFLRELDLPVAQATLTPKPTSLNSFNGIVTLEDGTRRFFKTHTESHTIIQEYYNAGMLANAGYPVIQPVFQSTEIGKQILLYEVIQDESVFDVAWRIEQGDHAFSDALAEAQIREDKALLERHLGLLTAITSEQNATAPIHQLFYHRLVGGRLKQFYSDKIILPTGEHSLSDVFQWTWVINGQEYTKTIALLIERATHLLNPHQSTQAIIGHGDAHNGNVFLQLAARRLLYFDPAFAGQHHPLLDIVKPIFHNVFAMWMYFPEEKRRSTSIHLQLTGHKAEVSYDYTLPTVRQMFLESKLYNVLLPILQHLKSTNQLESNWREFIKAALFCCPFLTMNLADLNRFSPEISTLGLAMSIEMGAESNTVRSLLDQYLDEIENAL